MLVLKVTDAAGVRSVEYPERPLLVGSDPGCDIVASGLAPEQLAIKPAGSVTWQFKLLAGQELKWNGRSCREGVLQIGDRLDLGPLVLAVEEMSLPQRRRLRRPAAARVPWGWVGLVVVAVLVLLGYDTFGRGGMTSPLAVEAKDQLNRWELDRAARLLEDLRIQGLGDRLKRREAERLAEELAARQGARVEAERRFAAEWERRGELSLGHLTLALRDLERAADRAGEKLVAEALRFRRNSLPDDYLREVGDPSGRRAAAAAADNQARIPVIEVMVRVDGLLAEERFEAALELISQARSEAGSAAAAADYEARRRAILADASNRTFEAVNQAYGLANVGRAGQGLEVLRRLQPLFPQDGELGRFHQRLRQAEMELLPLAGLAARARPSPAAGPKPVAGGGPSSQPVDWGRIAREREREAGAKERPAAPDRWTAAGVLKQADDESAQWRFGVAARLYGQVGEAYPAAGDKARLAEAKAELLLALAAAVKAAPGRFKGVRIEDGGRADLLDADEGGIGVLLDGVALRLGWLQLGMAAVLELARQVKVEGKAQLGLAALALQAGQPDQSDRILQAAVARDGSLLAAAEPLLRERTGKEGPFVWHGNQWLPVAERDLLVRTVETEKEARRLLALRDQAERSRALTALAAKGEAEGASVRRLMSERLRQLAAAIGQDAFLKQLDRISNLRRELDARRQEALGLIFDEEKYFYPFRPPECPPEKAKLYWPVQQEVDRRVARVKELWESRIRLPIPSSFLAEAREALWVLGFLAAHGGADSLEEDALAAALKLPLAEGEVSVRNFAWSPEERRRLDYSRRVQRFNQVVDVELTKAEAEQAAITNDYRLMLGRSALAVNPKIHRAARGHCEEMARLGYFSHFSPTADLRTPVNRMARQGYQAGVSENIARGLGAEEAHVAWVHSSGHHRNILNPGHREFASANIGDLWTQNYGRAAEFERDPLFEKE